jgi:hypothetical protein
MLEFEAGIGKKQLGRDTAVDIGVEVETAEKHQRGGLGYNPDSLATASLQRTSRK